MRDYFDWRFWVGKYLRRGYFSALDKQLRGVLPEHEKGVQREVEKQLRSIYEENEGRLVDQASKFLLMYSSLVLATYRVLFPLIGNRETVIESIRLALASPVEPMTRLRIVGMGISPFAPRKAFEQISKNAKRRGERLYGSYFLFEEELQDEKFSLNVRRCFFHDFFVAHGVPELTGIGCSLDNFWADELKKEKYGVRFERPTTLALGSDMCRFQFTKVGREAEGAKGEGDAGAGAGT